jgi:O-antigen/teichoic acid export membrane protein
MALKLVALNSMWLLLGTTASRAATLIANIFAARLLGPELFGQFMTIRATVAAIEAVFSASVGNIAVKTVSENLNDTRGGLLLLFKRLILLLLAASAVGVLVISCAALYFSRVSITTYPNLEMSFYIGCLLVVFTLCSSLALRVNIGLARFKDVALSGLVATALALPLIYYLTANFGIHGALAGVTLFFLLDATLKIIAIVIHTLARDRAPKRDQHGISSLEELFKASAPLATATIVSSFTIWGIRVVAASKDHGFAELAQFDAAYQVYAVMMVITGVTTGVALQMFSRPQAFHGYGKKEILGAHLLVNALVLSCLSLVAITMSRELMNLFGDEYGHNRGIIIALCIVSFLATSSSVCEKLFISAAHYGHVVLSNTTGALGALIVVWLARADDQAIVLTAAHVGYFFASLVYYVVAICWRRAALFPKAAQI